MNRRIFHHGCPGYRTLADHGTFLHGFAVLENDGADHQPGFQKCSFSIGLRHMYTRGARYRNFRVWVPELPSG